MTPSSFISQQWPDPGKHRIFVEEFDELYALTSDLPVVATSPWLGTATPGATGTFSQLAATVGGVGRITTPATDNIGVQLQGDLATWSLEAGKTFLGLVRVRLSDVVQTDFFAGVGTIDPTCHDGTGLTMTNYFGISKADGSAALNFVSCNATVVTSKAIGGSAPVNATWTTIEWRIVMDPTVAGQGMVDFLVDGVSAGSAQVTGMTAAVLSRTLLGVSGEAGAKTFDIDRLVLAQQL